MSGGRLAGLIVGGLAVACLAFIVTLFLVKVLWAWTIPDLFPGAVEQGLVASEISWLTAVKVALFVGLLSAFTRGGHAEKKRGE